MNPDKRLRAKVARAKVIIPKTPKKHPCKSCSTERKFCKMKCVELSTWEREQ